MITDTSPVPSYETVLQTVSTWSTRERFTLVQEILSSLMPPEPKDTLHRPTLSQALGLLATETHPAPTDNEIGNLLEERRKEKFDL